MDVDAHNSLKRKRQAAPSDRHQVRLEASKPGKKGGWFTTKTNKKQQKEKKIRKDQINKDRKKRKNEDSFKPVMGTIRGTRVGTVMRTGDAAPWYWSVCVSLLVSVFVMVSFRDLYCLLLAQILLLPSSSSKSSHRRFTANILGVRESEREGLASALRGRGQVLSSYFPSSSSLRAGIG